MTSRGRVLAAVRRGLRDVDDGAPPERVPIPPEPATGDPVERFVERVEEYGGEVRRVAAGAIPVSIADICKARGVTSLVATEGIDPAWLPQAEVEVSLSGRLDAAELDRFGGAVTGCRLAIADTGTIVLDGGPLSGRRAVTLAPDIHICVVSAQQVVSSVPTAVEQLGTAIRRERSPLTFVSGPSATSDIEFSRVEGVHGPRHLIVLLLT
jgi:L-lactate dehydrogenase complex protein LldG